jgi:hypothetical protein
LLVCFCLSAVYLFAGRLLRVAHARRYRLVDKSLILCGFAVFATETITTFSNTLQLFLLRRRNILRNHMKSENFLYHNVLKPLAFYFGSTVLLVTSVINTIMQVILKILFHSLVIWRGYRVYVHLPFSFNDQVHLIYAQIE